MPIQRPPLSVAQVPKVRPETRKSNAVNQTYLRNAPPNPPCYSLTGVGYAHRETDSRRNGAKSKGPITEEGKAISSRNGTTHGLAEGHKLLYSNERDDLFEELLAHYTNLSEPANGVEADLVSQIVTAACRVKRVDRVEAATVDIQMERQRKFVDKDFKELDDDTRQALAFQTDTVSGAALSGRYYARPSAPTTLPTESFANSSATA